MNNINNCLFYKKRDLHNKVDSFFAVTVEI